MWLAGLVNQNPVPRTINLLPYVAKEIYALDATGLSHLVAGVATGQLVGSTVVAAGVGATRSTRFMAINLALWYAAIALFAAMETKAAGIAVLFALGVVHSLAMVSMTGVLLRAVAERFRSRVMGIRMLCVYSLPIGLLATSPLIERFGFAATAWIYVALGLSVAGLIVRRWRASLWH
jgi:hypothetical protein